MRKELYKGFSCYSGIYEPEELSISEEPYICDVNDTELNKVLCEVFTPDPLTGIPRGDIAYFLSKDGNPVVKAWLETNLLSPRSVASGTSIEGVTDELIAEFARRPNEDSTVYAQRIASIRDEAIANIEKYKAKINNPE